MAGRIRRVLHAFTTIIPKRRPHQRPMQPSAAEVLAQQYTGTFAFLDERTNKSHQLAISPTLAIRIDGQTLPGQVIGITTTSLTFLDHYGYQLVVTLGAAGPSTIYDEAEDVTYTIATPPTE